MNFNYDGESSVNISWEQEDNKAVTSFFEEKFPEAQIVSKSTTITYAKFILNKANIKYLAAQLNNKAKISEDLKALMAKVPKYDEELKNQSLIPEEEIISTLKTRGFKRKLFSYQLRNVQHLISLAASADFSVPGAGKTTDALATYLFRRKSENDKVLIICPKSAFGAWKEDIRDVLTNESLSFLGNEKDTTLGLLAKSNFKIINYERYRSDPVVRGIINEDLLDPIKNYTLILDESHRIKGEKTYAAISELSVVNQKIILTGTPMPQSYDSDLPSQFLFLYPEENIKISDNQLILDKFQPLFKRTTKDELGLPEPKIIPHYLEMEGAQAELNERMQRPFLNTDLNFEKRDEIKAFKAVVMRYLQFCSNPQLQAGYLMQLHPKLAAKVLMEDFGVKFNKVIEDAEEAALNGEKIIIWSTFPKNLDLLSDRLSMFNPVVIHGGIPVGNNENEYGTRWWAIHQFKNNPDCKVFLANPATAGEGISLHRICSKALYLDRSYNAAHYLQSKDRIHRIGIDDDADIQIHLYLLKNSIDPDIDERLVKKTTAMAAFLNDDSIVESPQLLDVDEDQEADDESHIPDDADLKSFINFLKKSK